MLDWIYWLDIIGTMVFAISGVLTAIDNKFDIIGSAVIGLVTAVGGGTLRDILIGQTPVGWMLDVRYLWAIIIAIVIAYLFRKYILQFPKGMLLFDTIGIGLFTVLGVDKTLELGLAPSVAILMGMVSAVFGGVIRDVLTNEVPLIFRKEIYASACIIGGVVHFGLSGFLDAHIAMIVAMLTIMIIRYLALRYHWSIHISV